MSNRILVGTLVLVLLVSCVSSTSKKEFAALQAERDSLLVLTHEQDSVKSVMDSYVETIALALDSIKFQEQILTIRVDENGKPLRRDEVKENLELLADVIRRQREKIEEMEARLLSQGVDSTSNYRSIISHLYEELDRKNAQIDEMQIELDRRAAEVRRLNKRVVNLENDVASIADHAKAQAEIIEMQTEILEAQNKQLNIGYIKIGNRKELQNAGIIKSGLFAGSKLNDKGVDTDLLDEIDLRDFTRISLSSKKPKLLTSHPVSSYSMEKDGDMTTLVIINPAVFWSMSNCLIIQL